MKWIGRELERLSSEVKDLRDKVVAYRRGLQESRENQTHHNKELSGTWRKFMID